MARIRSIKPEFWTSEQVMECSLNARLMFIGLWNFCDDTGRQRCSPKQIKALIFPSDSITAENIRRMFDELSANGLLEIYVVDGKEYFQVTGWHHQKIDRPQPSKYPSPSEANSKPLHERSSNGIDGEEGRGEDRKGREEKEYMDGRDATRPLASDPFDEFWGAYPKRDGSNPKHPAKKKFLAALKSGVEAESIIGGAKRYASELASKQQVGTPYVKQAVGWLNARMWEDQAHHPTGPPNGAAGWKPGLPTREQLLKEFQNGKAVETDPGTSLAPLDEIGPEFWAGKPKLVSR